MAAAPARQVALGILILVATGFLIGSAVFAPKMWVAFFTSEVSAAWAQAVFSVVAIVASTQIWRRDRRREEAVRDRASAVADFRASLFLGPLLLTVKDVIPKIVHAGDAAAGRTVSGADVPNLRLPIVDELRQAMASVPGCSPPFEAELINVVAWASRFEFHAKQAWKEGVNDHGRSEVSLDEPEWSSAKVCLNALLTAARTLFDHTQVLAASAPKLTV
jgi:hypothetical protein